MSDSQVIVVSTPAVSCSQLTIPDPQSVTLILHMFGQKYIQLQLVCPFVIIISVN